MKNNIAYLNRDLDLMFYRFDLDGDGRVLYSEVFLLYNSLIAK
jgi:hypothetical protein